MEKYSRMKAVENDLMNSDAPLELRKAAELISQTWKEFIKDQEQRYSNVHVAIEAYMKARGKIMPPEFSDFFSWYFDRCAEDDSDFSREIQDADFIEYHKWRDTKLSIPSSKQEKNYTVRAGGIALILAFNAEKISKNLWYSNNLRVFAEDKFNIKNGHKTCRAAKENYNLLKEVQKDHPKDYKLGEDLFEKIF